MSDFCSSQKAYGDQNMKDTQTGIAKGILPRGTSSLPYSKKATGIVTFNQYAVPIWLPGYKAPRPVPRVNNVITPKTGTLERESRRLRLQTFAESMLASEHEGQTNPKHRQQLEELSTARRWTD